MADPIVTSSFSFTDSLVFQTVGLFFVVFLVILIFFRPKKSLPPGPRRWPIVGNIPTLMMSKKHPHVEMADWARQYGGVMTIRLRVSGPVCVVLSDIRVVKEGLLKQAESFADRLPPPISVRIFPVQGSFVWGNGDAAKNQRRFGLHALRSFGVGKKSLEHNINEEIRYLVECLENEKSRPFDPLLLLHNAVSNIICTISFGYRFNYLDLKFRRLLRLLKENLESTGPRALGNAFPFLIDTPLYNEARRRRDAIVDFITEIVQEHKDTYDPNDSRDIIDLCIAESKQRERDGTGGADAPTVFTDERYIWRAIVDLFGAGTDTTSTTVLWTIAHALKYPEIQDKMQREISDVIGGDRQPSCEDRPNMPYTNAVIMEVQRSTPVAPIAVPYKTSQEAKLLGYTIPKDTMVLINLWAVMHDPKVWERPDEFNPGRFLTEDGKKLVNHEAFIPFGIGRRSCLGENLAKMELFLFVTNLFQRFTFKSPPGAPPPSLRGVSGGTFVPRPFEICANKR